VVTDLLLSADQSLYIYIYIYKLYLSETREPFQLTFVKTTLYNQRQAKNAVCSHYKTNLEFHLQVIYGLLVTKLLR
jgi:hypothetical protein